MGSFYPIYFSNHWQFTLCEQIHVLLFQLKHNKEKQLKKCINSLTLQQPFCLKALFLWHDTFSHDFSWVPVSDLSIQWLTTVQHKASWLVHSMKGDRNAALHFCSGDLWQVLGIEDEEVPWSLGAWSHHDGQQHSCRTQNHIIMKTITVAIGFGWNQFI